MSNEKLTAICQRPGDKKGKSVQILGDHCLCFRAGYCDYEPATVAQVKARSEESGTLDARKVKVQMPAK